MARQGMPAWRKQGPPWASNGRGRLRDIYADGAWGVFLLRKIVSKLGNGREVLRTQDAVAPDGRAGGGMVARNGHAYAPSTRDLHSDSHMPPHSEHRETETEGAREDAELHAAEVDAACWDSARDSVIKQSQTCYPGREVPQSGRYLGKQLR